MGSVAYGNALQKDCTVWKTILFLCKLCSISIIILLFGVVTDSKTAKDLVLYITW